MFTTKSIAVLPFINISSDKENEYFADGMTDEIIIALSKIDGLKVTSRMSVYVFKDHNEDVRVIGNKLGVATILEGSVRKAGNRVRISTQLVRTDNGFQIWSEVFDRLLEDLFDVQDEISLLIAERIRENFGHINIQEHLIKAHTGSIDAYEIYLKAKYHLERKDLEDVKLALELLNKAVEVDPSYADAHALIGETYLHYSGFNLISQAEGFQKIQDSISRALELDPNHPKANKVLAYQQLFFEWNWNDAIESYNKAIEGGINNDNEFITYYYIFLQNDFDKAIRIAKEILTRDPLHINSHFQLGITYYFAKRYQDALKCFQDCLNIDPVSTEGLRWKGLVLGYLGEFDAGQESIQKALELSENHTLAKIDLMMLNILRGNKQEVLAQLETEEFLDPCDPAQLYSLMNMPEKAVPLLEKGFEEHAVMMVTLKHYWIWDNIRYDAGFQQLIKKMRFDQQKAHRENPKNNQLEAINSYQASEDEVSRITEQLETLMASQELVLTQDLTLRSLAEMLNIHSNKLSWLLNDHIGMNFNEFINSYRLDIFQEKALDPSNKHLSILGMAYDSGFSSKSVFNDFFKKKTGLTPKVWIKQQQK